MPREGRRPAPITSQVPIIRTGEKPDPAALHERRAIDDPRTSAQQTLAVDAKLGTAAPSPRKRPVSLSILATIAVIFLVLGGVAAVVFGNILDDPSDEPTQTTSAPTANTTQTSSSASTTAAQPTTTSRPERTTTTQPETTEPPTTVVEPPTTAVPAVSSLATTPAG
jgi:cytoskeletal protein RodZ